MRKIFIYILIFLPLFIPLAYGGFWYFSAFKVKSLLTDYINDEKVDISHDFSVFPFNLVFRVTNPKFSNEQLTVSSEALVIKNRLFDKSVYIYIPSNEVNIAVRSDEKKNIKCHTHVSSHFVVKLNDLLSSLKFNRNSTVIDYIDTFRYEDYGLKCDILENQQSVITEVNDKSNYIQFHFDKELNENTKLEFDFYTYRYKNTASPENYLSVDAKLYYEFVNHISASKINFNIEKFLIESNNFSIAANGGVSNYNLVTSSFEDKINVAISNYKELISFVTNDSKTADKLEKSISSLSEKITNNDIQFSIKYDNNVGSGFIGKLSTTDFITQFTKNENSN
ncbi:hypothetical protein [Wolbachia endosymbiont of Encarsia formosa]|uniref:hypothetical protein n=1 Tax=Wolbachia endosymbiont of Encarsia formosa TaxID=77125 RepID=UPI0031BAEDC0